MILDTAWRNLCNLQWLSTVSGQCPKHFVSDHSDSFRSIKSVHACMRSNTCLTICGRSKRFLGAFLPRCATPCRFGWYNELNLYNIQPYSAILVAQNTTFARSPQIGTANMTMFLSHVLRQEFLCSKSWPAQRNWLAGKDSSLALGLESVGTFRSFMIFYDDCLWQEETLETSKIIKECLSSKCKP